MVRERYLVRLRHDGRYVPAEWADLAVRSRDALAQTSARVGTVRIASRAVEIDLFTDGGAAVEPVLNLLEESVGPLIQCLHLDGPEEDTAPDAAVRRAVDLFNDERYWEAHEALEPLWIAAGGKASRAPEAQMLQGVILTAAALVHAQRAEDTVALRMLETALKKLGVWRGQAYHGLDVAALRERVQDCLGAGAVRPFRLA